MNEPTNIMGCKSYKTDEEKSERLARLKTYTKAFSELYGTTITISKVYADVSGDPIIMSTDGVLFREHELRSFE